MKRRDYYSVDEFRAAVGGTGRKKRREIRAATLQGMKTSRPPTRRRVGDRGIFFDALPGPADGRTFSRPLGEKRAFSRSSSLTRRANGCGGAP
jgi:hypothetical protein